MNAADRKRLIALLNRINQREPQKNDDLLLLARGYEDMALEASRAATAAARAEVARRVAEVVYRERGHNRGTELLVDAIRHALVDPDAAQQEVTE